ncbi:MAG: hypothetical protein NXH73_04245 [Flavobacteriaceae bacterium]|nr:hypothetical protein [Flavobacteriaceae bacterium]
MDGYNTDLIKMGGIYVKFKIESNQSNKKLIKEKCIKHFRYYYNKNILKNKEGIKTSIHFKEENAYLKIKILIWGTLTYMGVINNGSFKAGVLDIMNDINNFSKNGIQVLESKLNSHGHKILKLQRRTGMTGRIQNIFNKIDTFEKKLNNLDGIGYCIELYKIRQEVANIITILPKQDKHHFINNLDHVYKKNLPDPDVRRSNYLLNRYVFKHEENVMYI